MIILFTNTIIYLFLYLQSNRTIDFATITSRFKQTVFKRLLQITFSRDLCTSKDVHTEIRGFKVRTIGNSIRRLWYHKKEIRCRAIEDFRESSLRHSFADPFQTFLLVAIR